MTSTTACPSIEDWLESLDESDAAPEGAHSGCDTCRGHEASARELLHAVREGAPRWALSDEAFVRRVLEQRTQAERSGVVVRLATPFALAAAAVGLLVLRPGLFTSEPEAPVARGRVASPASASCEVARVAADGLQFLRQGDHVRDGERLAFRVQNPAREARWLGIFAVSATGRVGWYHPAYEAVGEDTRTLPLSATNDVQLLHESVALRLGEGPVRLVCWQSKEPWSVRDADAAVEAAVARGVDLSAWKPFAALGGDQPSVLLWLVASP